MWSVHRAGTSAQATFCIIVLLAALKECQRARTGSERGEPFHLAAMFLCHPAAIVTNRTAGTASVVVPASIIAVIQDEVEQQQEGHPHGVKDEQILG